MKKIAIASLFIVAAGVIFVLLGSPACGDFNLAQGKFIPLDWCINVQIRLHPENY